MSYDIYLADPITAEVIQLDEPHQMKGGTYAIGGTRDATLNITYNYGSIFRNVFGEKGIRTLYGITGEESLALLDLGIAKLGNNEDLDYWKPTEGNVKRSLYQLRALAVMCPNGVWQGD